ncbi:MAG: branched-chain amino acid transport system ATP-binding protein livF [Actinomycetota bacterium]|jgi:branched-chain amino acid transport system ATP-binding protein
MTDVALSIQDVQLAFGGVRALDGVTYDVPAGQIVGIIGPNGAGKTTLFDTISGFRKPDRGSIILSTPNGPVDLVREQPWRRTALGVGRTFQNARLFRSLSLRDILRTVQHDSMKHSGLLRSVLGTRGARADEAMVSRNADEALELVGLARHADKPAQELSTGMLRLCELAAVISVKPKLLLLDEPSSGIAQAETEALAPLLRRVAEHLGATMLLIEHDMPMIMNLSDTIVAMAAGKVVTYGAPADVRNHPEVLTSYLGQSV